MAKVFMKGNEAIGEAAVRAGVRFFAGYPITPSPSCLSISPGACRKSAACSSRARAKWPP